MELQTQIKKYRTDMKLSQEELAEKVYVSRQTISNWETGKSYPDIHSLLLLSSVFSISLDELVKGDIQTMKEMINEHDVQLFNKLSIIYTIHFIALIVSVVPLFMWLEQKAWLPFGLLFFITMYWAWKVEKMKKNNNIQTYKEIVAFSEGKKLDEISTLVEKGKRPYQFVLKIVLSIAITLIVCILIGLLMQIFLN
ncbi:MAG: helix-turn-helix transcriptional regulator [Bacillota bacterium]|nr:helix-turn-helix transcriptional regulator [Bacillota bacterium]